MVEREDGVIPDTRESWDDQTAVIEEAWRNTEISLREEYVEWARQQHHERQLIGIAKYGAVAFQGDPINQGIEENLDQLFYLYWAKKQLAFVEGQRNTYRHLLEGVIEFGLSQMLYEQITEELNASNS